METAQPPTSRHQQTRRTDTQKKTTEFVPGKDMGTL